MGARFSYSFADFPFNLCVRVCSIDLPVVDWKLETDIQKKHWSIPVLISESVYFVATPLQIFPLICVPCETSSADALLTNKFSMALRLKRSHLVLHSKL